jgi:hypothetical protein
MNRNRWLLKRVSQKQEKRVKSDQETDRKISLDTMLNTLRGIYSQGKLHSEDLLKVYPLISYVWIAELRNVKQSMPRRHVARIGKKHTKNWMGNLMGRDDLEHQ